MTAIPRTIVTIGGGRDQEQHDPNVEQDKAAFLVPWRRVVEEVVVRALDARAGCRCWSHIVNDVEDDVRKMDSVEKNPVG